MGRTAEPDTRGRSGGDTAELDELRHHWGSAHPDWAPVLRAMLFAVDRHRARQVTGLATGTARTAP